VSSSFLHARSLLEINAVDFEDMMHSATLQADLADAQENEREAASLSSDGMDFVTRAASALARAREVLHTVFKSQSTKRCVAVCPCSRLVLLLLLLIEGELEWIW
jgi:hypothetical protein